MTPKEFYELVKAKRKAQKKYFQFRTKQFLDESKILEGYIDKEIERVERIIAEQKQPRLDL